MAAKIDEKDLKRIREQLPWLDGLGIEIAEMGDKRAVLTLAASRDVLRPGGTVSGPAMMTLADAAMYFAILGTIGLVEMALTTSLSINFLRPPPPGEMRAECRILKLGKRLAYGEAFIYSAGADPEQPVAHATMTYSIPPDRPAPPAGTAS
ncbi:MAG: PaaI family thioesterase [Tistlia sp.]|uniref:PaaI family thioesterase n=1 Tax=Tistlia sp. TaxID=3057121 RepID=UPI0034A25E4A